MGKLQVAEITKGGRTWFNRQNARMSEVQLV
jgi:hypothetical protein